MRNVKASTFCRKHDACDEGREWAGTRTMREAWDDCERSDWMFWMLDKAGIKLDAITNAKLCVAFAEPVVKKYLTNKADTRPMDAINAAKRWISNPTEENWIAMAAARAAAWDAAMAAARDAARDAARAAARAAAWDAAMAAARAAACDAAMAAARAAAWDAAMAAAMAAAAWHAAWAEQCHVIRRHVPNPWGGES